MGLNIHCPFPAIAGRLECGPGAFGLPMDRIAALRPYFVKSLPELASVEFLPAPEQAGTPSDPPAALAMTLAWLTAQLQNLGNACVSDVAIARTADGNVVALSGYQVPEVAVQAMQLARAFIAEGWEALEPARAMSTAQSGLRRDIENFIQFARSLHLDVMTHSVVSAARARNIPHFRLCSSARFIQLGQGVHQQHIFETLSDRTSEVGAKIAHNKIATFHLLQNLGLPVPDQIPAVTFEQAAGAAARLGYPVVVKPSHGQQTIGVTVDIRNPQELKAAFDLAANAGLGGVLVEKFVPGYHHRLSVIDGRLVAAVRWTPAHVVGDGVRTVEQLIALANQDPRRGEARGFDYDFGRKRVRMSPNAEMARMLAAQGYGYASVPPQGRTVPLHGTMTIGSGGDGVEVTDEVHPDVREMAELIAQAFKLDAVGIDYLTTDVARSYRDGGGAICEVNACPGFRGHWLIGVDRDKILDALLRLHFSANQTGRVPTVAIAASPGAATVARWVAHILETSGRTTALAFAGGVTIGARQIRVGDCGGGGLARSVMMDPRVEAVVMELGCASLLGAGMPVDSCDFGVVIDVDFDHTRHAGIDSVEALGAVKSLVAKAATRYAVLNADDARCVSMAADLRHVPVCLVSVHPESPVLKTHGLASGMTAKLTGTGADAEIMIALGAHRRCVARVCDIAATVNGTTRVREALFTAVIACALDIPREQIVAGLGSFQPDPGGD